MTYKRQEYTLKVKYGISSEEEAIERAKSCLKTLSNLLSDKPYFFGDKPSSFDAIVYGHIIFFKDLNLPKNILRPLLDEYQNLSKLCDKITKTYFSITHYNSLSFSLMNTEKKRTYEEEGTSKATVLALIFASITITAFLYKKIRIQQ